MSTNALFMLTFTLIVVMSVFVGALVPGEASSFSVGGEVPEPSVWNVLTFVGGTFWEMLSFSISGLPWIFGLFFWCLVFMNAWCLVRLIRGG